MTKELQENPSALSCHSSIHNTACRRVTGVGFVSVHSATKHAVCEHERCITSALSVTCCSPRPQLGRHSSCHWLSCCRRGLGAAVGKLALPGQPHRPLWSHVSGCCGPSWAGGGKRGCCELACLVIGSQSFGTSYRRSIIPLVPPRITCSNKWTTPSSVMPVLVMLEATPNRLVCELQS